MLITDLRTVPGLRISRAVSRLPHMTGTTLHSTSSRCKCSIGVGAATKYLNTASCVESLWIVNAGCNLSLMLQVIGCETES
jgi:hypothetical protein